MREKLLPGLCHYATRSMLAEPFIPPSLEREACGGRAHSSNREVTAVITGDVRKEPVNKQSGIL